MQKHRHLGYASIIFLFAYALRKAFFCGFILGDDAQEFPLLQHILVAGPDLRDQLHLRFGVWVLNYPFLKLFGVSETTFFLPTWLISSAMAAVGYLLLIRWGNPTSYAFWGGLFVASAPFEILMGTVRANDLFLAAAVVGGILALVCLQGRPILQGIALAVFFWFGLYVKVWAVYFLPALIVYYGVALRRGDSRHGVVSFVVGSVVLHGLIGLYWTLTIGAFLPFVAYHPPTTPIPLQELGRVFSFYPIMLFSGSEFGTTLFGAVPYLLVLLLLCKGMAAWRGGDRFKLLKPDGIDLGLLSLYGSFFLFLNFFPNSFTFDQYYSIPRIFRYLTPLSFPMTLHVAKMLCDLLRVQMTRARYGWKAASVSHAVFAFFIYLNVVHADEATKPGQAYRQAFQAVIEGVRAERPPVLLAESWVGEFIRRLYLKEIAGRITTVPFEVREAKKYEVWLQQQQNTLPVGSMLVTGLASYVHYGRHDDGFRLSQLSRPLHPNWELVKEYGVLDYLPIPEKVRLWRLAVPIATRVVAETSGTKGSLEDWPDLDALYKRGQEAFDRQDCGQARLYFRKVFEGLPDKGAGARYFYAVCLYRDGDWQGTIREFEHFMERYPKSHWIAAAHWHIAMALRELKEDADAREHFEYVIAYFPDDKPLVALSVEALKPLGRDGGGFVGRLWRRFKRAIFE